MLCFASRIWLKIVWNAWMMQSNSTDYGQTLVSAFFSASESSSTIESRIKRYKLYQCQPTTDIIISPVELCSYNSQSGNGQGCLHSLSNSLVSRHYFTGTPLHFTLLFHITHTVTKHIENRNGVVIKSNCILEYMFQFLIRSCSKAHFRQ